VQLVQQVFSWFDGCFNLDSGYNPSSNRVLMDGKSFKIT